MGTAYYIHMMQYYVIVVNYEELLVMWEKILVLSLLREYEHLHGTCFKCETKCIQRKKPK